jgi:hypothetical protein
VGNIFLGLKREAKRALDLPCFEIIGKEGELHIPIRVWGRGFTVFAAGVSIVAKI